MIKTAAADSWFRLEETPASLVKYASRGLKGLDRQQFIKCASAELAHKLDSIQLAPDEELVHIPLVGTTESYNPNRNGDGFPKVACAKYAYTFMKLGRLYENHKNDDPKQSYGRIPLAMYLPALERIDVVAGYNGSKKTAAVNGGLVDTRVLPALHAGKVTSHSMSCRVPYDVCSGCNNRSRTREDYCTSDMCKYGGLKEHICKIASDGHCLHAINDHPYFFDCSRVPKPAERIANAFGIVKAAAAKQHVPVMLDLEEQFACQEMAGIEAKIKAAAYHRTTGRLQAPPPGYTLEEKLAALTKQKILLPLPEYLELCGVEPAQAKQAAAHLSPNLCYLYRNFDPALHGEQQIVPYAVATFPVLQKWAASMAEDFSLCPRYSTKRARLAAIRGETQIVKPGLCKVADAIEQSLLDDYREYQRRFLTTVFRDFPSDFSSVRLLTVCRNQVN